MRIVLASASPRRAELLRAAGYEFDIFSVDVDETLRDDESPSAYVRRLAADKSARAAGVLADLKVRTTNGGTRAPIGPTGVVQAFRPAESDRTIILGADTTVVVDGEILGKPRDDNEAAAMLRRLSGRRHDVLTGVSVRRGAAEIGRVETTAVYFARLSDEDIAGYVARGEGRDKAGAYAIQGLASRFVLRIEGSYSNVVGLPISTVHELVALILASPV